MLLAFGLTLSTASHAGGGIPKPDCIDISEIEYKFDDPFDMRDDDLPNVDKICGYFTSINYNFNSNHTVLVAGETKIPLESLKMSDYRDILKRLSDHISKNVEERTNQLDPVSKKDAELCKKMSAVQHFITQKVMFDLFGDIEAVAAAAPKQAGYSFSPYCN